MHVRFYCKANMLPKNFNLFGVDHVLMVGSICLFSGIIMLIFMKFLVFIPRRKLHHCIYFSSSSVYKCIILGLNELSFGRFCVISDIKLLAFPLANLQC